MYFPLFVGVLCLSLFCYVFLCAHSSFAIILKRKRKLVAMLLLSYRCIVTINILWLSLTVLGVGLQCVIVVFADHAHFLFPINDKICTLNILFPRMVGAFFISFEPVLKYPTMWYVQPAKPQIRLRIRAV